MFKKLAIAAAVLVAAAAFFIFGPSKSGAGSTPPDFQLYTTHGRLVTLSEYRGRVVVLDFWASWCPPCRMAIPAIQRIHQAYKDQGVAVFGVNINDNKDPAEFMEKMNATYPVLVSGDEVAREYRVRGIPTLVVIGPDGKVAYREAGWSTAREREICVVIDEQLERAAP